MVDRHDSWELTLAITGDVNQATDAYFTEHIVAMINELREDRDHALNQLKAARAHIDVIERKRAYPDKAWNSNDVATLQRILADHLPTPLEELRRAREMHHNED